MMSLNLVIALLALIVIMTNINWIEMAPAKSSTSTDYYQTRAWGGSSVPFTVIYGRSKPQQKTTRTTSKTTTTTTTTTTVAPKQQNRRQNTTTRKPSNIPNLFVSKGWGPLG